jgi:hypothetical protein
MPTLLQRPILLKKLGDRTYSLWLNKDSYKEFYDSQSFINTVIEVLKEFKISKTPEEVLKVILNIFMYDKAQLISSPSIKILEEIKKRFENKSISSFIK